MIPIETKHRQTLESSRDPAESERTLCRDGRASTGSESQCGLPPSGIPELYSGGCTEIRRRELMAVEWNIDGYVRLAHAIVEKAGRDYRTVLKKLKRHPGIWIPVLSFPILPAVRLCKILRYRSLSVRLSSAVLSL